MCTIRPANGKRYDKGRKATFITTHDSAKVIFCEYDEVVPPLLSFLPWWVLSHKHYKYKVREAPRRCWFNYQPSGGAISCGKWMLLLNWDDGNDVKSQRIWRWIVDGIVWIILEYISCWDWRQFRLESRILMRTLRGV